MILLGSRTLYSTLINQTSELFIDFVNGFSKYEVIMTDYTKRLRIPIIPDTPIKLYTYPSQLIVANAYTRIVIGQRGPYIEFTREQLYRDNFTIPYNEEYRLINPKVYYIEYRSIVDWVKLYWQRRLVDYADYHLNMGYISPFDLIFFDNTGQPVSLIEPLRKPKQPKGVV